MRSSGDGNGRPVVGPAISADEITREWLNQTLGPVLGGQVTGLAADPIGTGQVGENVRFRLAGSAAMTSLVGKFPSTSELSLAIARESGLYHNEVGFYRDAKPLITITTPTVYYLGFDAESNLFCIIMEDMAPATQGDQLAGTDLATAEVVMDEAAGLHAPTWGRAEELTTFEWLEAPSIESMAARLELARALQPGFEEMYRDRLDPLTLDVGSRLVDTIDALVTVRADLEVAGVDPYANLCLTHGDFRLDNFLISSGPAVGGPAGSAGPRVATVDWQTCRLGTGPADIAYFCGAGLDPMVRAANERALLKRYQAGLEAGGVSVDEGWLWEQYVIGSSGGYLMAVIASQVVGRTERGDDMFCAMAERHAVQMSEVGFFELLG